MPSPTCRSTASKTSASAGRARRLPSSAPVTPRPAANCRSTPMAAAFPTCIPACTACMRCRRACARCPAPPPRRSPAPESRSATASAACSPQAAPSSCRTRHYKKSAGITENVMRRSKPKSKIMVADGAGGLLEVVDRRFERRDWPISFQVPAVEANNWFRHLEFEFERHGWSSAGMSQLQSRENSGSLMLLDAGAEKLSVVWDRARGEALNIRARPTATLDLADAQESFRSVNERSSADTTEPQYRWGTLEYEGRAWRGEIWLGDDLRLRPPSKQYVQASRGLRVDVLDGV